MKTLFYKNISILLFLCIFISGCEFSIDFLPGECNITDRTEFIYQADISIENENIEVIETIRLNTLMIDIFWEYDPFEEIFIGSIDTPINLAKSSIYMNDASEDTLSFFKFEYNEANRTIIIKKLSPYTHNGLTVNIIEYQD